MLQDNKSHLSYITTNYELHYDKPQVTLRQTGAHITSKHQSVTPQKFTLVDVQREKFSFSSQKSRAKI